MKHYNWLEVYLLNVENVDFPLSPNLISTMKMKSAANLEKSFSMINQLIMLTRLFQNDRFLKKRLNKRKLRNKQDKRVKKELNLNKKRNNSKDQNIKNLTVMN